MTDRRFPAGPGCPFARNREGFTLVEMLVATAVTVLIILIMSQTISGVSRLWTQSSGRVGVYASARASFEAVSRNLSQATLNTYLSYANSSGTPVPLINPSFKLPTGDVRRNQVPSKYVRMSELHFVTAPTAALMTEAKISDFSNANVAPGHSVFFQAPTGFVRDANNRPKATLLNVLGYYVIFGSDAAVRPDTVTSRTKERYRYRLMEALQPTEKNSIYASTCQQDSDKLPVFEYDLKWITALDLASTAAPQQPLADNIILMAVLPKLSKLESADPTSLVGDEYIYDSRDWEPSSTLRQKDQPIMRNQLPPIVELIMIAVDEPSAEKMAMKYGGADGKQPPLADGGVTATVDLASLFLKPSELEEDLAEVEAGLSELGIAHRIFRTDVVLPGAKWSSQ